MGVYSKGVLKCLLVVGLIPVQIFLLIDYFFDASHTSNRVFLRDMQFSLVNALLPICSSRVGACVRESD